MSTSQSSEHQADYENVDKGRASFRQAPIILVHTPFAIQTGKGALNNPTLGQHLKTDLITDIFDNLPGPAKAVPHPVDQISSVATIHSEDSQTAQAGNAVDQGLQLHD